MSITLKEIADMAGVHKSTVDKVIHNRPGVSDTKRQQIRQLLNEHGYASNPLAKALNYQKKKLTVAVVLPPVDATPELRAGAERVQQDFISFNIELQYFTPVSAAEQAECLLSLCKRRIAGAVICPIEDASIANALSALHEAGVPVVTVNSDLTNTPRLCFVGQDMVQSGQTAARLISLLLGGQGELGIIASRNMHAVIRRKQAFLEYLSPHWPGIHVTEIIDINETPEQAYQLTCGLLTRQPSLQALFITCGCVPDICRAVRDCGFAGKLTILCFERYPDVARLIDAGEITCTISGGLQEQGHAAMRLLFEYLIYDRIPAQSQVYTKNEILFRENI